VGCRQRHLPHPSHSGAILTVHRFAQQGTLQVVFSPYLCEIEQFYRLSLPSLVGFDVNKWTGWHVCLGGDSALDFQFLPSALIDAQDNPRRPDWPLPRELRLCGGRTTHPPPTTKSSLAMAANHRKGAGSGNTWGLDSGKYVTGTFHAPETIALLTSPPSFQPDRPGTGPLVPPDS